MKITKSQHAEAINKEVTRLKQISLMESRLTELNRERKVLSEGIEDGLSEGDLPSISPEALIDPMETEVVQNFDGEDIDGVELIELTWQDENELFGDKDGDGILAREFSDIFSKESMESYTGREIKDHHLPIEREMLWFRLIAPIAFHYMYGEEGKWYSKSEAANMAKERGKKYVIAQYMS